MLSQILDFFCNFLNNHGDMKMFTYLGPMDLLSLLALVILFIAVIQEMSHFGTPCAVCDVTKHYWYWLDSSGSVWIHSGDVCPTPVSGQKYPKIK